MQIGNFKKLSTWLLIFFGILMIVSALSPKTPQFPKAKPYEIIIRKDFSLNDRKRMECSIISQSELLDERAQTAMKAALDFQKETGADVVSVWYEISRDFAGKGLLLAVARYAPDGKGFSGDQKWKWEVEATSETPDKTTIEISKLWYQHRESFMDSNRFVDEDRLKRFISKKLQISSEKVNLPVYALQAYQINNEAR